MFKMYIFLDVYYDSISFCQQLLTIQVQWENTVQFNSKMNKIYKLVSHEDISLIRDIKIEYTYVYISTYSDFKNLTVLILGKSSLMLSKSQGIIPGSCKS